jgi:hypothetical protein
VLVLTGGTAYALDGSNTVFGDDIVDGQVRTADIRMPTSRRTSSAGRHAIPCKAALLLCATDESQVPSGRITSNLRELARASATTS